MVLRRRPIYRINKTKQEQIYQEEIYRRDIRLALKRQDTKQTLKQKIWVAINSAFFLWFLSTVVVGSIVFLYTQHTERSKEREQDRVAIRKLDTEIKSRLYYVARQIDPKRIEDSNVSSVLLSMEKPSLERYPINVFPEYEKRNMRSLLWELHTLVPEMEKVEINTQAWKSMGVRPTQLTIKQPAFEKFRSDYDLFQNLQNLHECWDV